MRAAAVCLLAFTLAATRLSAAELWLGAATTSITPDRPVAVDGHRNLRISNKIESRVTATALALESREGSKNLDQAIMVPCDLVGIRAGSLEKVREKVKPRLAEFDIGKLQHSSRTPCAWEKPS